MKTRCSASETAGGRCARAEGGTEVGGKPPGGGPGGGGMEPPAAMTRLKILMMNAGLFLTVEKSRLWISSKAARARCVETLPNKSRARPSMSRRSNKPEAKIPCKTCSTSGATFVEVEELYGGGAGAGGWDGAVVGAEVEGFGVV